MNLKILIGLKKYHVYRMDWDEKEIKLYVDDELRNSIKVEEFLNEDGSIVFTILNICGSIWL